MIARASSGSRSRISSVEPLMSANNAVTVLRSPSSESAECGSESRRIVAAGEESGLTGFASWSKAAAPHLLQNFAPAVRVAPQHEQAIWNLAPHCSQKRASPAL